MSKEYCETFQLLYFLCEASIQCESSLAERSCHTRNKWSLQLSFLELPASWLVYLCILEFWCPLSVPVKPHDLPSIYAPCQATINFCLDLVMNMRKNNSAVCGRTAQTILRHGQWQRKRSFSAPIMWSKDLHKGERQELEENWGKPINEHCISWQAGTLLCSQHTGQHPLENPVLFLGARAYVHQRCI